MCYLCRWAIPPGRDEGGSTKKTLFNITINGEVHLSNMTQSSSLEITAMRPLQAHTLTYWF